MEWPEQERRGATNGTLVELKERCTLDVNDRKSAEEELRRLNAELTDQGLQIRAAVAQLQIAQHELRTTQLQLIQAGKLNSVGKLTAGVAHEVKNPLQTMLMGLTYLDHELAQSRPELREACQDMRQAVMRADSIIRGLLQLSGHPNLEMGWTDLNGLAENALALVHYNLDATRVTTLRRLEANLPRLWLDGGKMEQVLINLLTNAIQAMPEGGTLTLTTTRQAASGTAPERVVVIVQDTGLGISPEHFTQLFTPFFTTKKKEMGTGLGLLVSRSIIEMHGGTLELTNAAEGGARATIKLPVKES